MNRGALPAIFCNPRDALYAVPFRSDRESYMLTSILHVLLPKGEVPLFGILGWQLPTLPTVFYLLFLHLGEPHLINGKMFFLCTTLMYGRLRSNRPCSFWAIANIEEWDERPLDLDKCQNRRHRGQSSLHLWHTLTFPYISYGVTVWKRKLEPKISPDPPHLALQPVPPTWKKL